MKQYDIYGIGNALLDMVYEIDASMIDTLGVDKGVMTLIDEEAHQQLLAHLSDLDATYACGGSAANTIITAQDLGAHTFYSCNVADDTSGNLYYHDLITKGTDTNLTETNRQQEQLTGKCIVLVTPDADRTMCTFLGATTYLSKVAINEQALAKSRYVYIEGYLAAQELATEAAIKVRELANQYQVKTTLTLSDPNMVTYFKDNLLKMIGDKPIDILFCNESEALLFCETESLATAQEQLKTYAKQFVITLGERGALAFDGTTTHELPAHPTNPIDTVGAGDTFAGAFLYALTRGAEFPEATDFANQAAARIVAKLGPRLTAAELQEIELMEKVQN